MSGFRKDRVRPAIDGDILSKIPLAPKHIRKGEPGKLWKVVCKDLLDRGRLYSVGTHIIQQYVESYAIYDDATSQIFDGESISVKDGDAQRKNPIYQIRSKALEEMNKLEKLLGLSPYSRDRITVSEPEEEGDHLDGL